MEDRLTKITTRTGDDGSTGLGEGSRTGKQSKRIHIIGEVDELNAFIGLLRTEELPTNINHALQNIQHRLFDLGGELSIPGHAIITDEQVTELDEMLQTYNAALPPLREFILPGGTRAAALAHVCRTVSRRAERSLVRLAGEEKTNPLAVRYLNRLSDLMFVIARVLNQVAEQKDEFWETVRAQANT